MASRAGRRGIEQRDAAASRGIDDAYQLARDRALADLRVLTERIQEARDAGEPVSIAWLYQAHRLHGFLVATQAQMDGFAHQALDITETAQAASVAAGAADALDALDATVPKGVTWAFNAVPAHALDQMGRNASNGQPLAKLFDGFGDEAAQRARATLLSGVGLGWSPDQIARQLANELDISRQRARCIAQTEMMRAYNDAARETYAANRDVVEAWIWVADLAGACAACVAMNGTEHEFEDDIDGHPNCRCEAVPKTRDWADILGDAGIDTEGLDLEETSADVQDGSAWFDEQDAATQRAILGPGKYAAWQDGQFQLSDLVGIDDDPEWGRSIYEKPLKAVGG